MTDYKEQKFKAGDDVITKDFPDYEIVEHKIGNQTNVDENNNKFFSIELHKCKNGKYRVYTNYGRVENKDFTGVVGIYGPDDEQSITAFFNSKWKEKSKKYKEISFVRAKVGSPKSRNKVYGVSEDEIPDDKKKKLNESKKTTAPTPKIDLHPTVKKLIEQWYRESSTAIKSNAAVDITSDGITTPLGVLTFKALETGKTILGELGDAVKNKDQKEIRKLTSNFYSFIPAKLGRKITDDDLIATDVLIQQKLDLLDMMKDALDVGGATFVSDTEKKYLELGVDIEFLDKKDPEWIRLEKKVRDTKGYNHYSTTVKVRNIMRIKLNADRNRYSLNKVHNENELWHGSRNCNIIGIMRSGMKIAPKEAPRSGLAFGRGAYFADKSSKSINYSLYAYPGVEKADNCFLFVFAVKLGKQLETFYGNGDEADICQKKGFNSVFAKEGKGLLHNEFIIPEVDQCSAQYIIELER
jgi:poly [ADP-ribose] polymerase 2/3/4